MVVLRGVTDTFKPGGENLIKVIFQELLFDDVCFSETQTCSKGSNYEVL